MAWWHDGTGHEYQMIDVAKFKEMDLCHLDLILDLYFPDFLTNHNGTRVVCRVFLVVFNPHMDEKTDARSFMIGQKVQKVQIENEIDDTNPFLFYFVIAYHFAK